MNLTISSEKIGNSLLVELLRKLSASFADMQQDFFVIGATARDIIMRQLADVTPMRRTRDLDIAIAIPDWNSFEQIAEKLKTDGFDKDTHMLQRFHYGDYEVDIVPYGKIAKEDDYIYWPPEETIAMSVRGFDEVLSDAIAVSIDGEFTVKIASLHGLFLLKFNAWLDRHISSTKDAEDMSFIIENYFIANLDRNIHEEVYDWPEFDDYKVGGYWLAHDLSDLLTVDQKLYYKERIEEELAKEDASPLINQILEHSNGLSYDLVYSTWMQFVEIFGEDVDCL